MLLAVSLMLMNQQHVLDKASLSKHIKVGCILICRWDMIRGSQEPNPPFPLGAVVQNSPIHCCQQLYWTQWPQKMRINNIYHQLPDLKLDHCFSTHHSASTATSQLNIHTYSHRYARRHTHCNLRQALTSVHAHIYTGFSPEWLTSFLEFRTKQKCKALVQSLWKTERRQNRVLSQLQVLSTHCTLTKLALPLPPTTQSWPHCSACTSFFSGTKKSWSLFTLHHLKWVYQAIWTYQMSAGKRVIDPQTYTVMTWWLKSWLGLWPPGIKGLGGDFIFLTDDQPESRGHACQSTAELQGSTRSLASPLGHILCKKSP